MKIKYIANDGTMFDKEADCKNYESCKEKEKNIIGLSQALDYIEYDDPNFFRDAHYIFCKNNSAVVSLLARSSAEQEDIHGIYSPGLYFWNMGDDTFYLVEDEIETLENRLEVLRTAVETTIKALINKQGE